MRYELFALAGVMLVLLALLVYRARRKQISPLDEAEKPLHLTPQAQLYKLQKCENFWGVSVESHCRASSQLAGEKFPFESAPHLPARACEEVTCKCSYFGLPERRRLVDRRRGEDRRSSLRMDSNDRRDERPRRKVELISWQAYRHL